MREIKFRAWLDKSRMNFSGDTYGDFLDFFTICRQCNDGFGNCYLMQFTGLLDKNGKEIYEGDIIKTSIGIQVVKDLFCNFVIYTYEDIDRMNQPEKYLEIIGNIYENPELLKRHC